MGNLPDFRLWIFRHRGVIPIAFILSILFFNFFTDATSPYDSVLEMLGVAVIGGGLALRAWAVGYAGRHTRSYKLRSPRLVTSGPYAFVRNPIYLGNLLIGLGIVIMAQKWIVFGVFLVGFWAEYGAIVSLEEEFLSNAFGDRYDEYRRRVPRWLPRLTPAQTSAPDSFSWRALRKEYLAVLSALVMAGAVELSEHLRSLILR